MVISLHYRKKDKPKTQIDMAAIHINKNDFLTKVWNYENSPNEFKLNSDRPVIVDFFATWCAPCKALAPILDELADEYAGRIDIYKVDTGEEEELSEAFNIRSIPTLLFCPKEGKPGMTQGALPKETLRQIIEENLLK